MEVCAAVRQGVPVLPVRLFGKGMRPFDAPIWTPLGTPEQNTAIHKNKKDLVLNSVSIANTGNGAGITGKEKSELGSSHAGGNDGVRVQSDVAGAVVDGTANKKDRRMRQCAVEAFYVQLSQGLPKAVQEELHKNRFLVKDVVAAVRACFNSVEDDGLSFEVVGDADMAESTQTKGSADLKQDGKVGASKSRAEAAGSSPPTFDVSAPSTDHARVLVELVGIDRRKVKGNEGNRLKGASWNWDQVPRRAEKVGRMRRYEVVPFRTDEEVSELIKEEGTEADDLAGKD